MYVGHFLWLNEQQNGRIWSSTIPPTGSGCVLEMALLQVEMRDGNIRLVIETPHEPNENYTSWVAADRAGNNNATLVVIFNHTTHLIQITV